MDIQETNTKKDEIEINVFCILTNLHFWLLLKLIK